MKSVIPYKFRVKTDCSDRELMVFSQYLEYCNFKTNIPYYLQFIIIVVTLNIVNDLFAKDKGLCCLKIAKLEDEPKPT